MEYIQQLIKDASVERVLSANGNVYGIMVLGRGENLFFQENDKALICEIDAVDSLVFTKSIKNWSGYKKMNEAERNRVVELIKHYYKMAYKRDLHIA